jgi:hypothetical protein
MLAIRRWFPGDAQVMQLLVNRGYLDEVQVEFSRAYQVLDGANSLLEVAIARGYVDRATVKRVLAEAREDEILRGLIRRYGLFGESQLGLVRRLQRGTKRSLLATLVQEGLCPPALKSHLKAVPKGWSDVA